MDIPFSTEPNGADRRWQQLLQTVFDPLEIASNASATIAPALYNEGVELRLPPTSSVAAVSLKFCQGGKRLFSSEDLHFARRLLKLLEHAEQSRESYEKGRMQERQRIAQDLHDDIGARLLSSLHSEDLGSARNSIRKTIADLRAVVGGLIGTQTRLSVLLSTLRFEASTRLEEARIEIDWPINAPDETALVVDYRFTKNVSSIMREIISNVLVHAKASRVTVKTELNGTLFYMAVTDDGIGLTEGSTHGNGLNNIRNRTTAINGTLVINSSNAGLRLQMTFPLTLEHRA